MADQKDKKVLVWSPGTAWLNSELYRIVRTMYSSFWVHVSTEETLKFFTHSILMSTSSTTDWSDWYCTVRCVEVWLTAGLRPMRDHKSVLAYWHRHFKGSGAIGGHRQYATAPLDLTWPIVIEFIHPHGYSTLLLKYWCVLHHKLLWLTTTHSLKSTA